jgi:hypothetical protein
MFGDAVKTPMPATAAVFGEPRNFRVDCVFTVFCCDDNMRGTVERQRGDAASPGVVKMFSDVDEKLSGVQLARRGDETIIFNPNADPVDGDVLLNDQPLTPVGDRIIELPAIACYGADFETYFEWTEPDRSAEGTQVVEIDLTFSPTDREEQTSQLPGVVIE